MCIRLVYPDRHLDFSTFLRTIGLTSECTSSKKLRNETPSLTTSLGRNVVVHTMTDVLLLTVDLPTVLLPSTLDATYHEARDTRLNFTRA